jgi:hypothetical protein
VVRLPRMWLLRRWRTYTHPLDAASGAAQVTVHNTWRRIPSGIPSRRELREEKLRQINADLRRPRTPEEDAVDRMRIARQRAKDLGLGQLV